MDWLAVLKWLFLIEFWLLSWMGALEVAHVRHAVNPRLWMALGFLGPIGIVGAFLAPTEKPPQPKG